MAEDIRITDIREKSKALIDAIIEYSESPYFYDGRSASIAITNIEQGTMWALRAACPNPGAKE